MSGDAYKVADQIAAYQESALIGTAVEVGLPNLLYGSPHNLEGITASLGTDPRGTMGLLAGLVTFGLVERDGETFSLTANGELLADEHPDSIAMISRKEWFFYKLWAEMPAAVRTGHTQTRAWRDRLENDPDQAHDFLRALDDLCRLYGGDLPELAGLENGGRLLDVGGGAGSHAANLVKAVDGLEATVLDLPGAEPVLEERHPGLAFVAGDIDQPRFGRPARPSRRGERADRPRGGRPACPRRHPGHLRMGDRRGPHLTARGRIVHPDDGDRERRRLDLDRKRDRRVAPGRGPRAPAHQPGPRPDRGSQSDPALGTLAETED